MRKEKSRRKRNTVNGREHRIQRKMYNKRPVSCNWYSHIDKLKYQEKGRFFYQKVLFPVNKNANLQFALSFVRAHKRDAEVLFDYMYNKVHTDETWLYLSRLKQLFSFYF